MQLDGDTLTNKSIFIIVVAGSHDLRISLPLMLLMRMRTFLLVLTFLLLLSENK